MPTIRNFKELKVWQEAKELAIFCYNSLGTLKDYSFKDQLCRAVVSISNNIAEGFDRQNNKEFKHFLLISKGSCAEVQSMAYLALELAYISKDQFNQIIEKAEIISKMLSKLIGHLKLHC